jgi:hypothetical protein
MAEYDKLVTIPNLDTVVFKLIRDGKYNWLNWLVLKIMGEETNLQCAFCKGCDKRTLMKDIDILFKMLESEVYTKYRPTYKRYLIAKEVMHHWNDNLDRAKRGESVDTRAYKCAFCNSFLGLNCSGCPVFTVTKATGCLGNIGYQKVKVAREALRYANLEVKSIVKSELIAAVEKEIKFLENVCVEWILGVI